MSRSKKNIDDSKKPKIRPETKNSIVAISLIGLAVILLLASFEKAGPAGQLIYLLFNKAFGAGYYILPAISLIIAFAFIFSSQKKFFGVTFIGATVFLIFGLGLLDILLPKQAGLVGSSVGAIELILGYPASLVLTATFIIAGLLLTLNASIRFAIRKKKEGESSFAKATAGEEKPLVIKTPEPIVAQPTAAAETKPAKSESSFAKASEDEEKPDFDLPMPKGRIKSFNAKNYVAPPLSLLKSSTEKPTAGDLRANANIIKRTLDSFGIPVEMGEINIGPKVTRYTLKPAEGVKLSRIVALNSDLALALAAHPIRIEAPIPGKSLVGIEVPNKSAALVRLGSLMAYQDFQNAGPLAFIVGRDVTGEPIIADVEKMPHLLVAGATGSGKSVMIHSMIVSLLYKNSPDILKLVLIDPKRVELTAYDGVPHLITKVITDGKKTISVFRWVIQEMERRYELLQNAGSRDIHSFNKMADQPMSYILIVVDELADLMAAYGREIESSVVRLAQMARATGIHLVVSTQRPSVEVITGLIKANITSRVALQVASQVDSRTILDSAGAEKLLGGGDLLFISSEFSKPKRIQGAYISEEEINKVADFIKDNNGFAGESEITVMPGSPALPNDWSADEEDELFDEAIQVVKEAKKASASLLQRRLKVGYARAARLLDLMEAKNLIGPGEGAKPREILMDLGDDSIDNKDGDAI